MNSIVLLSSGLDSTVCLAQAMIETNVKMCLTFDYGQKAAKQEIAHAKELANYYHVSHKVINLDFFQDLSNNALTNNALSIPKVEEKALDNLAESLKSAAAVWVPNRNGIFINIASGFAEALQCEIVVTGFNKEEAATFPDNSLEYVVACNHALNFSTRNKVKVISYTQNLNKQEIVALGDRIKVPWNYIWSCYYGGEKMCGQCESCRRFLRAINGQKK